jgi:exopolysaccharide biosynthesis predicted pyruvyltransferase EpsI
MAAAVEKAGGPAPVSGSIEGDVLELRQLFAAELDARIPAGSRVAFLEFPYDTNVGNHMMWLAALRYFEDRNVEVVYSSHINGFNAGALRRALGDGMIVFNGGVGMSALWPRLTDLKRAVVRQFPNNPLLVFPSTVAFRNREEADRMSDVFTGHGRVTIFARDSQTHRVVSETFRDVETLLVPDSAWLLPMQERKVPASYDVTWLVRNDHESIGYEPPGNVHTFDWANRTLVQPTHFPFAHYCMRAAGAATRLRNTGLSPRLPERLANRLTNAMYTVASEAILKSGNDDLDRGRVVVTDRFHAHILAVLRRQHVVLLVDAFGKNKNSYDSWTHRFPLVHLAQTPAEALAIAERLAKDA